MRVHVGAEFGNWTVLSYHGGKKWLCECVCATKRPVLTSALGTGRSQSCGCASGKRQRVPTREGKAQHGMTGTPIHNSWVGMLQRCTDTNHRLYHRYGGRGIAVCERWLEFENFLADMGEKPDGYTLERKDNDKGYEPSNCEWLTRTQQTRNRSNTVRVTHEGLTLPLAEWCERKGRNYAIVRQRIQRGWSVDIALTEPTNPISLSKTPCSST